MPTSSSLKRKTSAVKSQDSARPLSVQESTLPIKLIHLNTDTVSALVSHTMGLLVGLCRVTGDSCLYKKAFAPSICTVSANSRQLSFPHFCVSVCMCLKEKICSAVCE